jgi:hypothetical protein
VKIAPLFACIGLAVSLAGPVGRAEAEAINATWAGSVDTLDNNCVPFLCGTGQGSGPDTPIIAEVLTLFHQGESTYVVVSSLLAFTDVGSTTISSRGVAQVDALRTPASSVCCFVGGEAFYSLRFDSLDVPLAVDLSGTMHRSGPDFNFLTIPGVEFSNSQGLFGVHLPPFPAPSPGDYPFEFHTVLPPNSGSNGLFVAAPEFLFALPVEQTGEMRIVWNLQVTPVPWAATLLLILVGGTGLLLCSNSMRVRKNLEALKVSVAELVR